MVYDVAPEILVHITLIIPAPPESVGAAGASGAALVLSVTVLDQVESPAAAVALTWTSYRVPGSRLGIVTPSEVKFPISVHVF